MKKIKITSGILIVMLIFNMIFTSAVLAGNWENSPIKISVSIEKNGVYSSEELDAISFDVSNSSSLTRSFTVTISLKDAYNNVLWSRDTTEKLAGKTTEKKLLHMIDFSVGDYVLTGGELAAAIITDAVVRLIPGAIGDEQSALSDSFQDNLLAPPVYTRPAEYKGWKVPDILLSGHQRKIEEWRLQQAQERTARLRPDLLKK